MYRFYFQLIQFIFVSQYNNLQRASTHHSKKEDEKTNEEF